RQDTSNQDLRFTRNRIRHELLPLLHANYNPAIVSLLGRLADQAAELFEDVEQRAGQLLKECELPRAGAMFGIDAGKLSASPSHLLREALRLLWRREGWPCDRVRFQDWEKAAEVVTGQLSAVDLPGPIRIRGQGRVVQIGPV